MKTSWTPSHLNYLRELRMEDPSHKMVLEEMLMHSIQSRIDRYDVMISTTVKGWKWEPVVKALQSLKGIKELTAVVLVSELGDIRRFERPRQLMALLGVITMEYTSSENRRQAAITKAGNSHARSFLVESAQHYKNTPKISQNLSRRQQGVSPEIKEIAWNAQVRLFKRYWTLHNRGKNRNTATVAIAKELIGFIWDIYPKAAVNC